MENDEGRASNGATVLFDREEEFTYFDGVSLNRGMIRNVLRKKKREVRFNVFHLRPSDRLRWVKVKEVESFM